jgi:hypothetical protein
MSAMVIAPSEVKVVCLPGAFGWVKATQATPISLRKAEYADTLTRILAGAENR